MTWWHRLRRRSKLEEQLEKEMCFHLDQHVADLIARGHHPEDAWRQARLAFGGPEQVKEKCRDARGTRWLEDLGRTSAMRFAPCGRSPDLRLSPCSRWPSVQE